MDPETSNSSNRSIPFVTGLLVVWTVITIFGVRLIYSGNISLEDIVKNGIAWQLVAAVLFLIVVIAVRKWRDLGLQGPLPGTLKLLWFPFLILSLLGAGAVALGLPPVSVMLMVLLNTALVGFSEEVMFRGIFYSTLRDRLKIWPAIIWTSVVFGAVHVLNGILTGEYGAASVQALAAATSGLVFIAIRLRTGSLWIAIIYHLLWDWILFCALAGLTSAGHEPVADVPDGIGPAMFVPFILVLPNALYALWLLRHVGKELPPGDPKYQAG